MKAPGVRSQRLGNGAMRQDHRSSRWGGVNSPSDTADSTAEDPAWVEPPERLQRLSRTALPDTINQ